MNNKKTLMFSFCSDYLKFSIWKKNTSNEFEHKKKCLKNVHRRTRDRMLKECFWCKLQKTHDFDTVRFKISTLYGAPNMCASLFRSPIYRSLSHKFLIGVARPLFLAEFDTYTICSNVCGYVPVID